MASSNSVGTAYLTLVPKLDSNMSEVENGLNSAGTSGGNAFASGFKKIAKAAVWAKVGAEAAELFLQAFNGAAEYEQLTGGVEKIFDEMDSSQILKDARDAWSSMNMSANDYLSVMNDVGAMFSATMGDEKAYYTAKIGLQAIADYASGTGKSVETLDEKFAMITRATSSYQSIADQFAGILPATSADFLEQAQAAGFLSEEYDKLTNVPVAEYQEAVALMLQKGTEELGLAGNTANETERTVSGSIAGMKAAFQNLVVSLGIGGDTMRSDLEAFVKQFGYTAKNVFELTGEILSNVGDMIAENLPELLSSTITYLVEHIPDILAVALELFGQIVVGLVNTIPLLVDRIPEMIATVTEKIDSYASAFGEAGAQLIIGLADGISNAFSWVTNAIENLCSNALDAVNSFFGIASPSRVMRKMGGYIGEGMALGIEDSEDMVDRAMRGVMTTAYDGAASFAMGGTVNYSINGLSINGDRNMEQAMVTIMNGMRRRGAMA